MTVRIQPIVLALYLIGCLLGYLWYNQLQNKIVTLTIDAAISSGNAIEVYVNHNFSEPLRTAVSSSQRTTYTFRNAPSAVWGMRIDPTDAVDAEVLIFNIAFKTKEQTLAEIPPAALARWSVAGAEARLIETAGGQALSIRSTSRDPIIFGSPNLLLQTGRFTYLSRPFLSIAAQDTLFLVVALVLGAWLGTAALCTKLPLPLVTAPIMLAGLYWAARLAASYVAALPAPFVSAANAVGYAVLIPFSYQAEARTVIAAIACACAISLAAGLIVCRPSASRAGADVDAAPRARAASVLLLAAAAVALGLYFLPQLPQLFASLQSVRHASDYDSQNVISWQYAVWKGWLPYRDFWYPYSGYYLMSLPWPPQIIFQYLHITLIYALFLTASLWLLDFRPWRFLCYLVLLAAGIASGAVPAAVVSRYLLSMDVVLLFAMALSGRSRWYWGLHAAWTSYAVFAEVSQVIYALPGCVLLLGGRLWGIRRDRPQLLFLARALAVWILVSTTCLGLFLAAAWARGQLPGLLRFYASLFQDMVAGCALPADVLTWFELHPTKENMVFLAMLAAFVLSVLHMLAAPARAMPWRLAPLAGASVVAMIFAKHLIRPHMAWQFIALPVLLVLLLCSAHFPARRHRATLLVPAALLLGFATTLIAAFCGRSLRGLVDQAGSAVRTLPSNAAFMARGLHPWTPLAEGYFSPAAFMLRGMAGTALRDMFLSAAPDLHQQELFVLGDDSFLYILLDKKLSPYISFYNQSGLKDQQQTVSWLREHHPKYVIWDPHTSHFDSVPNIVRTPLVFRHVIQHYRPLTTVGPYLLLGDRDARAPLDWNFWRQTLGAKIELGFIPGTSGAKAALDKALQQITPSRLASFAIITAPAQEGEKTDEFEIKVAGQTYAVGYRTHPRIGKYYVRLDRLWFYQLGRKHGSVAGVASTTSQGWPVEVSSLPLAEAVLY